MKLFLFILSAACCLFHAEAQKRAFMIADLYAIRSVEDPRISPDGRRVAFVLREDDLAAGKSYAALYVMDRDGGNQRRLTPEKGNDTHPAGRLTDRPFSSSPQVKMEPRRMCSHWRGRNQNS